MGALESVWTGTLYVGDKVEAPAQQLSTEVAAIWGIPSGVTDLAKHISIALINAVMEESRPIQNHEQWPWPVTQWAKVAPLPRSEGTPADIVAWAQVWVPHMLHTFGQGSEGFREISAGEPMNLARILFERLATVQNIAVLSIRAGALQIQVARLIPRGEPRHLVLFHSAKGIRPMLFLPQQMTTNRQRQARCALEKWITTAEAVPPAELIPGTTHPNT
jgi:hypothetical protein